MTRIKIKIKIISIPNVAPGHLRSLKPPGMLTTIKFHEKLRFMRKTHFIKSIYKLEKTKQTKENKKPREIEKSKNTKNRRDIYIFVYTGRYLCVYIYIYIYRDKAIYYV